MSFKIYRETAVPSAPSIEPYAVYLVAPTSKPDYVEVYCSNSTGSALKRVINGDDVQDLINSSLSGFDTLEIVDDITARDALTPTANIQVFVVDASDDSTVSSGGATYLYRLSNTSWIKISESESLDLVLSWANITGKPSSSVEDIDDAVGLSHNHTNKTQLDKIGEDGAGNFTYNGSLPVIAWSSTGW